MPPAAESRGGAEPAASASATAAEIEEDRQYYAGLPLGLLRPLVLDYGAAAAPGRRRYLTYFLHRHLEMRLPEAQSAAELALEGGHAARLSGGSSGSSSAGAGGSGSPAVIWEKPFDNRVSRAWSPLYFKSERAWRVHEAPSPF